MASTTTTMTSGIENPMNSTKTTTTTGNHQNFNENLENRKKNSSKSFMQLNIETIPDSFQAKVSMKHQCYRLVPDTILSPIDDDDAENDVKDNNHHNSNNNDDHLTKKFINKQMFNSESKNFCQQKKQRRQLPKIPLDKKRKSIYLLFIIDK